MFRSGFHPQSHRGAMLFLAACLGSGTAGVRGEEGAPAPRPRSPIDIAFTRDSRTAVVSDWTAGALVFIDPATGERRREIPMRGKPAGLALSPDGRLLYCAEYDAGTVAEIDLERGELARRLPAGLRPMGVAPVPGRDRLLVADTVTGEVSVIDLLKGIEIGRVRVPREPFFLAVSPDGMLAAVGNLLPDGSPTSPGYAAVVSLLDLGGKGLPRVVADVRLPPGSTSVREIEISPDGRWAYAVHTLGRFNVPATQVERGWINTNALSIIDLRARARYATVLLDAMNEGAADPWGLALSADGRNLWISLRGVHRIALLDLERLHELLAGGDGPAVESAASRPRIEPSIWDAVRDDPSKRQLLADDITALDVAGVIRRFPSAGIGPRGLALSPDGALLAAANYYSGEAAFLDPASGRLLRSAPVGPRPPETLERLGERIFHDATTSFQGWLSCSTCHPDNGRNDGLRWDLANDELGTPQKTRSLLRSFLVAPTTARGVRPNFEASVIAGFRFLNEEPRRDRVEAVMAYLSGLQPESSPYLLPGGKLSEAAERGRAIFQNEGDCVRCHNGPIRTDLEAHDIGTASADEPGGARFYTPKLLELYRTAPFLHDGRAPDLRSIFARWNAAGRHGDAAGLTPGQLDDLIAYLLTL